MNKAYLRKINLVMSVVPILNVITLCLTNVPVSADEAKWEEIAPQTDVVTGEGTHIFYWEINMPI